MRDGAVIAGVGESARLGKVMDRSPMQLMAEAARAALDDCGLSMADIDGFITTPLRVMPMNPPATLVASAFGLQPAWLTTMDLAGASGTAMVQQAAAAIAAGQCKAVLCVGGQNLLSHGSRNSAVQAMAQSGVAHPQFELTQGPLIASLYALIASQHMATFGTTEEQMAEVAVSLRANATLNPKAQKRDAITVADVMASRPITSPLKILDCSLVSDGAAAFIVTAADRAGDAGQPLGERPALHAWDGLRRQAGRYFLHPNFRNDAHRLVIEAAEYRGLAAEEERAGLWVQVATELQLAGQRRDQPAVRPRVLHRRQLAARGEVVGHDRGEG